MKLASSRTFIVDCHRCRAKVGAVENGRAEISGMDDDGEPYGERLLVGVCPVCKSLLAGHTYQIGFEGIDSEDDVWKEIVRVFPKPPRIFSSYNIPTDVTKSLLEGERSLQASAYIAACVMFGRALEALCRDKLSLGSDADVAKTSGGTGNAKRIMLGKGIQLLRDKKIIDDRLYDWSQQLQIFRNLAAHPEGTDISREDAEDLQTFVNAIVEYIYDLTDRYEDFKWRLQKKSEIKARRLKKS